MREGHKVTTEIEQDEFNEMAATMSWRRTEINSKEWEKWKRKREMKEVGSKLPTHGKWCVKKCWQNELLPTSDVKIGDPAYCIIKADRGAD